MKGTALTLSVGLVAALGLMPVPARADVPYRIFVDGRRVDAHSASGLSRDGVMYINVVRAVKVFNGLLTFAPGGRTRVTIGGRTLDFQNGNPFAYSGTSRLRLPGPPFVADGDTFVPLATIAKLASVSLSVDVVGRRDLLTTPPLPAFTPTPGPLQTSSNSSEDLVPSPAQALAMTPSAKSDAAGLHARVDVTNKTARPYTVTFPTSRQFEFIVARNGSEIWNSLPVTVSSALPPGASPPSTLVLAPHGTTTATADWPGYAKVGLGRYTLRIRLLTAVAIDGPPISLDAPQPIAN